MTRPFELGLHTFVDYNPAEGGRLGISPEQRMKNLLEEAKLADEVGLDVFGVGEHHRPDYLASSPSTILAAIAGITSNIRLTSAVTVLGTDDPVRVFQQYATIDLISGGRAEIMAGRGSFSESFPLFMGGRTFDYDTLFAERLDLLLRARAQTRVNWQGTYRTALSGEGIYPRPVPKDDPHAELPVWLAVGGTPASAVRAGQLGLPMALAIIGGMPEQFAGFVELYRDSARSAGKLPQTALGINSHGFIAENSQYAADLYFPAHAAQMDRIGAERGWPRMRRDAFENDRSLRGAVFAGDPEQVTEKILFHHDLFHHQRFLMQSVGMLPHRQVMKSIELFGTQVAPAVRQEIARREAAQAQLDTALTPPKDCL